MRADVAAIIPCFNSEQTLGRALDSVAQQTLPVRETIVIDDGSANPGAISNIVSSFAARIPITLLRSEFNKGVADARNRGVAKAQAKYVAFLDADDVWFPEKIQFQYAVMESGAAAISGHDFVQSIGANHRRAVPSQVRSRRVSLRGLWLTNPYCTPTVMARRSTFVPFDAGFRRCEDYKCWIENIAAHGVGLFIEVPLAGSYKPSLGHSGLSGSVLAMHRSWVDALRTMRHDAVISEGFFLTALVTEHMKLPLRVARTVLARWVRLR